MFHSHEDALIGLFWLLLGLVEEDKISVKDPAFHLTSAFGRLFLMTYVVSMVIVALNMLIAMMNNSFERIMVSLIGPGQVMSVNFVICSKQGPKMEGAVLNRVGILGLYCPKQIESGFLTLSGTPAPKHASCPFPRDK